MPAQNNPNLVLNQDHLVEREMEAAAALKKISQDEVANNQPEDQLKTEPNLENE